MRLLVPLLILLLTSCAGGVVIGNEDVGPPDSWPLPADTSRGEGFPVCQREKITVTTKKPSEILLVVDRSGSMRRELPSKLTKWEAVEKALGKFADTAVGQHIGLSIFPRVTGCQPGIMNVYPAAGTAAAIKKELQTPPTSGSFTPTASTLNALRPLFKNRGANRYIVLATDGKPVCDEKDLNALETDTLVVKAVTDLKKDGVSTIIIGFGKDVVDARPDLLDKMATAGGLPRTGTTHKFYDPEDQASLDAAIKQISQIVGTAPCYFPFENLKKNAVVSSVTLDGKKIPRNNTDGWSSDTLGLTFHGASCKQLQSGETDLSVEFKCPTTPR